MKPRSQLPADLQWKLSERSAPYLWVRRDQQGPALAKLRNQLVRMLAAENAKYGTAYRMDIVDPRQTRF